MNFMHMLEWRKYIYILMNQDGIIKPKNFIMNIIIYLNLVTKIKMKIILKIIENILLMNILIPYRNMPKKKKIFYLV